jgi:hypothetical protein
VTTTATAGHGILSLLPDGRGECNLSEPMGADDIIHTAHDQHICRRVTHLPWEDRAGDLHRCWACTRTWTARNRRGVRADDAPPRPSRPPIPLHVQATG